MVGVLFCREVVIIFGPQPYSIRGANHGVGGAKIKGYVGRLQFHVVPASSLNFFHVFVVRVGGG